MYKKQYDRYTKMWKRDKKETKSIAGFFITLFSIAMFFYFKEEYNLSFVLRLLSAVGIWVVLIVGANFVIDIGAKVSDSIDSWVGKLFKAKDEKEKDHIPYKLLKAVNDISEKKMTYIAMPIFMGTLEDFREYAMEYGTSETVHSIGEIIRKTEDITNSLVVEFVVKAVLVLKELSQTDSLSEEIEKVTSENAEKFEKIYDFLKEEKEFNESEEGKEFKKMVKAENYLERKVDEYLPAMLWAKEHSKV